MGLPAPVDQRISPPACLRTEEACRGPRTGAAAPNCCIPIQAKFINAGFRFAGHKTRGLARICVVLDDRTDAELLAATSGEPEAFGVFYRRHVDWVLRVAARRTGSAEHAADLTAETFAAALLASGRFRPEAGAANSWLFGILVKKLAGFARRGAVEERARRRLELDTPALAAWQFDRLLDPELDGPDVIELLKRLPEDQQSAVRQRVIEDRSYAEVAASLGVSEAGARKRVSRALAALRIEMDKEAS